MKKYLLLILLTVTFTAYGQQTSKPAYGVEVERRLSYIDIEGDLVDDVTIIIKSNDPDYVFTNPKVSVKVIDENGKIIWKKSLRNAYLWIFSGGQIQVGKPHFCQILVNKSLFGSDAGKIRLREGIYGSE